MGQAAFILGCAGLTLTSRERAFFRDLDPWGFILFARNVETPDQIRALTGELRDAVGRDAPILIDQEGGRVQRLRPPHWRDHLPPLDQIEAARDPARSMWVRSRLIAEELHALGIDVNCAPTLDVATHETHPFLRNRCYGTDAATVASMGRAVVDGMAAGGVASVAKHIPGHGRATVDSHLDLPRVTADRGALAEDFATFRALNDLSMAMTAHIVYDAIDPDLPATQSPAAIDLIRTDIGFDGLLMSDDISMGALAGTLIERSAASIAAGCDLLLHCNGDMAEMEQIAPIGAMGHAAQIRANRAAQTRPAHRPIDIAGLEAELQALVAG